MEAKTELGHAVKVQLLASAKALQSEISNDVDFSTSAEPAPEEAYASEADAIGSYGDMAAQAMPTAAQATADDTLGDVLSAQLSTAIAAIKRESYQSALEALLDAIQITELKMVELSSEHPEASTDLWDYQILQMGASRVEKRVAEAEAENRATTGGGGPPTPPAPPPPPPPVGGSGKDGFVKSLLRKLRGLCGKLYALVKSLVTPKGWTVSGGMGVPGLANGQIALHFGK